MCWEWHLLMKLRKLMPFRLQYREVAQAIDEFSLLLEESALENAVEPPAHVKTSLFATLSQETNGKLHNQPDEEEEDKTPVVHITFFRRWRIVAAASIILLIASAALNFYLYQRYQDKNAQYLSLLSERNTLQANNQIYQTRLTEWQSVSSIMGSIDVIAVKMKDPSGGTPNVATVFWNPKTQQVYLMPNSLPTPAAGKQYQLWALVDGKPVDAGVLSQGCVGACKMKQISKAQTFAITLEQAGGSPTPNLKALYVIGNV